MIHAYKEIYLNHAADNFGSMTDYAINYCQLDGDFFLQMFISSGFVQQFENGNPRVIVGMSGVDLANRVICNVTEKTPSVKLSDSNYRTAEYWGGWALAQYQWYTAFNFSTIMRILSFKEILNLYSSLHTADISKFYSVINKMYARKYPQINLKRFREAAGLSQAQLAAQSEVSLRSIQMYEQRNKDIKKAQAITLAKIASVLGCELKELLN